MLQRGLLTLFLLSLIFCVKAQNELQVIKGKCDLTHWDRASNPSIPLNGEWEFCWNKLIGSAEFARLPKKVFAQLSLPWNEQTIDGQTYPSNGFASYRLQVMLPEGIDSVAFQVPAVFNSYHFFVDDKLICASGKVASVAQDMVPKWDPTTVVVPVTSRTMQVVFQIANFQNTRGGCAEVMRIGDAQYLRNLDQTFHRSGYGLIILFLVAAMTAGVLFAFLNVKSFLYLMLVSLAFVLRFLFSDLYFYQSLGIELDWATVAKIEYSTILVIILAASWFLAAIYPSEFKKGAIYFYAVVNVLSILVLAFSPSSLFSSILFVFQIIGLSFIAYVVYGLIKAIVYKRVGAWVSLIGIAVFCAIGAYNIIAFVNILDLNRLVIHVGYAIALILNFISLLYRTPMRLDAEENMLRYEDLYGSSATVSK